MNSGILLVEPFYTGSHKDWADGLARRFEGKMQLLTLPGRHWKWRMQGGAVELADRYARLTDTPSLIVATDMLDVAVFKALSGAKAPIHLYFHENQINYPWSPEDPDIKLQRDLNYGFTNYTSALAADKVYFNSAFHRDAFLDGLYRFLARLPDYKGLDKVRQIAGKSSVLPLGADLKRFDTFKTAASKLPPSPALHIVWNHRWEYDKNPSAFFSALYALDELGIDFRLSVLGESYGKTPQVFEEARIRLAHKIAHWGYAKSFEDYAKILCGADIALTTSFHDFFGLSVIEAAYCGLMTILPNRLAYPNHFPPPKYPSIFYENDEEILSMLMRLACDRSLLQKGLCATAAARYDWELVFPLYESAFT